MLSTFVNQKYNVYLFYNRPKQERTRVTYSNQMKNLVGASFKTLQESEIGFKNVQPITKIANEVVAEVTVPFRQLWDLNQNLVQLTDNHSLGHMIRIQSTR